MKERILILILVLITLTTSVFAETYYADVVLDVKNNGDVLISGITNHPELEIEKSTELTSKKGKHWMLNISLNGTFSDFVYEVQLPDNSVINYMKLPSDARIEDANGGMKIIGTGHNQKFIIILQYRIKSGLKSNFSYIIYLFIILVIAFGAYLYINRKKKKIELPAMTERQKDIFELIKKSKSLTQKNIADKLGLPKSSVSRNINSLKRKGLIKKEKRGMSNIIKVNVPHNSGKFRGK